MADSKSSATQAVQDIFLNNLRKDRSPVVIFLQKGVRLTGVVHSFDKFCVLLENSEGASLIFKQAILTVSRLPKHAIEQAERQRMLHTGSTPSR